jgi:hypothetical protein
VDAGRGFERWWGGNELVDFRLRSSKSCRLPVSDGYGVAGVLLSRTFFVAFSFDIITNTKTAAPHYRRWKKKFKNLEQQVTVVPYLDPTVPSVVNLKQDQNLCSFTFDFHKF